MKWKSELTLGVVVVLAAYMCGLAQARSSGQDEKVNGLIEALGDRSRWTEALEGLVEIGEPAVDPLIRTLKDRSIKPWVIQARAVDALAKIATREAIRAVTDCLRDRKANEYVRAAAAMAVADLKPDGAVAALREILSDKSQMVRWKSAQALGKLGDAAGVDALLAALKDEDQYVRAAAARSLGELGSGKAADSLIEALSDESWVVRLNARNALLQTKGEAAAERLIRALGDENPHVRWQAAWVLGRVKSEEAIEPLVETLGDADWMVRGEAAVALVRIDSEKAIELLAEAPKHESAYVCEEAAWVLEQMQSDKAAEENESRETYSAKKAPDEVLYNDKTYPCYPQTLDALPGIPSPHTTEDGTETVTAFTKDGKYALIPVTVENGEPLNYKQNQWGKGWQLRVDAGGFPTLAATGLHSEVELNQTKMITGRSIVEITELGRPGRSSGAGFMSNDEDVISVLRGDNRLVRELGLTHQQMARPLFHVWNMILRDIELGRFGRFWDSFGHVIYNGRRVCLKAEGSKGWQESLFDDEILGKFQIEVRRELDQGEKAFLRERYADLTEDQMAEFVKKLSYFHTGEMVSYYIMRYGFYEGHTAYRADPIAIALVFGLRSLEEIEAAFPRKLYETLMMHFTPERLAQP